MSVCEFSFPIQRPQIIDSDGYLKYREPEFAPCRSQDLQKCYQDCGLFYFFSQNAMEQKLQFFKEIMELKSLNIDEQEFVSSVSSDIFKTLLR